MSRKPKGDNKKKTITLRLSPDVIESLRQIKGYNALVDDILRDYLEKKKKLVDK